MKILGIETSCDETGASVVESNGKTLGLVSNVLASSIKLHAETGGIIPESAAREQLKFIIPVIQKDLPDSGLDKDKPNIDAIAVTVGPGLIGSLLVGVETAKTLSYVWDIPLIPVNHLYGHIYANFIDQQTDYSKQTTAVVGSQKAVSRKIEFPAVCLVVSGGHTDLVLMKNYKQLKWIGGTRDDAAGEALDKIGRLLNLPYPAGPKIEELAKDGKVSYNFPRPLMGSGDFDFSFSGLKTAVLREVKAIEQLNNETINDLSASVQEAVVDVLVKKTIRA